jgi:hypothetical protein
VTQPDLVTRAPAPPLPAVSSVQRLLEPVGVPPGPTGEAAIPVQSIADSFPELPLASVPVVAPLLGDGPLRVLPAQPLPAPRAEPGERPEPVERTVVQRVRWERDEPGHSVAPGQPVVQRSTWAPARQPSVPARVELSSVPGRLDGVNGYGVHGYGVGTTGSDTDLPPAYPTVSRARDAPVVPVQQPAFVENSPGPVAHLVQRVEQAGVPVLVQAAPDPPAAPVPAPPVAPAAPGAGPGAAPGAPEGGAPAASAAAEPEELLKKLFDPLLRRLKTELRLDRERYGALTDRT